MLKLIENPALYEMHATACKSLGLHLEQRGDSVIQRVDAAGDTMHLARELEFVSAESYQVLTDPIRGRQFVDFTTIPDGAETFAYDMWDRLAKVEWITNYSQFVGAADVSKARTQVPMKDFGSSYHYSVQDLQRCAFARTSLPAERATSCRIGHEQFLDNVIAFGDEDRDIEGLCNTTAFPEVDSTVGEWDPTDAEPTDPDLYEAKSQALVNDFMALVDSIEQTSAEQFSANLAVFPLSFKPVLSRRFSRYDSRSREQVMKAERPGVEIKYWKKLNEASALGGPKAIAYQKSKLVLEFVIAYDFRELPAQAQAYAYQIATHARVGGLHVRYPLACARMDLDKDITP